MLLCGHLLAQISGHVIGNIFDKVIVVEFCSLWRATGAGVNISFGTSILMGLFLERHAALRLSSDFVLVRGVFHLTVYTSTISRTDTQTAHNLWVSSLGSVCSSVRRVWGRCFPSPL